MANEERKRKLWETREKLTEEGKELWDNMMQGDPDFTTHDEVMAMGAAVVVKNSRRQKEVIKEVIKIIETDETQRLRIELRKMMQVSQVVIAQCSVDLELYTKSEEYFKANECKTAILCHANLIIRLRKILDGGSAYDTPSVLMNQSDNLAVR